MTRFRKLINVLSFLTGISFCLVALTWVFISASGAIKTGQAFDYISGVAFLLFATPFLAFPFSVRLAKRLGVLCLSILALSMLWLAFQPGNPMERPALAQAVAIAFVVLLFTRVGLALRRKRSGSGA